MRAFLLVVPLLIVGCSSRSVRFDAGTPPPGTDGGTPPGTDAPACTGACGSDELFPLGVGMRWDYAIARGARPGCDTGTVSITITSMGTDASGDTYYVRELSCGSYPTSEVKRVGDSVFVRGGGTSEWYLMMTLPPVDGAEWAAGGASGARYRWTAVPSITVPAGTFTGCWSRDQIGYDMGEVYCPGVGAVTSDYHAWSQDEGYDLTGRSP